MGDTEEAATTLERIVNTYPDATIAMIARDLLDDACVAARKEGKFGIHEADLRRVLAEKTGLPVADEDIINRVGIAAHQVGGR